MTKKMKALQLNGYLNSGEPSVNFFSVTNFQNHNYQNIAVNLINNPIIPNPDPMKRIIAFHFRISGIRQIFR